MSKLDRKYRDGVRAYILSLTPERRKDFQYQLLQTINLHKRDLRDLKEQLMEEVSALTFLEESLYVLPFRRREDQPKPDEQAQLQPDTAKKKRA